jgi:rhodanese-related sulfurtransferase
METVDSRVLATRVRPTWVHGRAAHVSMVHMGTIEGEVNEADVADVPVTFNDSVVLLDVREDDEWARGHASGARHIPMSDVPARIGELDVDAKLFVVCHAGGRSMKVAQYLANSGYEPINVSGGMLAWAGAGRPVVTDDGSVGTV